MHTATKQRDGFNGHLIRLVCLALALFAQCGAGAHAKPNDTPDKMHLDLADRPLLTGTNVKPNVMVAVDDSASMDSEVLTPASDGAYYWNNSGFVTNGTYHNGPDNKKYIYLFPNGCNNHRDLGRRSQCDNLNKNKEHRYAIPPISELGFTRSPDYNKAYFKPSDNYKPWIGYQDAWKINPAGLTAIPYSPEADSSSNTIDLTANRQSSQPDATFFFSSGMTVPAGTLFYHNTKADVKISEICDNISRDPASSPFPDAVTYCQEYENNPEYSVFKKISDLCYYSGDGGVIGKVCDQYEPGVNKTGFYSEDSNTKITGDYAVSYFPATFYVPASQLPPGYSSYAKDTSVTAPGPVTPAHPDGETLVRYQIKPGNFDDPRQYEAAIHNFANWFTYYRKRHLAVRGGIVSAFDRISGVRAGSCTINKRRTINMFDLDISSQRLQFYNKIFDIDYSRALGTPNRAAVDFLGHQLENNESIIQSPCQKNYAILFTDGYNSKTVAGIGDVDGDGHPNTIADIAQHYYDDLGTLRFANNIARDELTRPPACDADDTPAYIDCEDDLHMNLLGVTLGQSGTVFDGSNNNQDPYTNPPDWSNIDTNKQSAPEQIDDLWHATVNSHGALLNAQTPQDLADKFSGALANVLNAPGSASSVAADSASVTDSSVSYSASYVSGVWTGELTAYSARHANTPAWKASTQFNKDSDNYTAPDDRVILTSVDNGNGYQPKAFRPDDLQDAFGSSLGDALDGVLGSLLGASPDLSQARKDFVNYLRGDRSKEQGQKNGTLRYRGNDILGDIVHSTPAYVGAPQRIRYPLTWNDRRYPNADMDENGHPYYKPGDNTAFAQKYADREPMVYVGANDGLLHGFDATAGDDGGKEKMAYVPGALLSKLPRLAAPDYKHRFYVDGSPATGDVFFDGAWHTVLVGGLGNGGRSIYALDITDPSRFSEASPKKTVMWEYRDPGLGQTFGKPQIVRLHDGRWVALFANGYNSTNNDAALYVVNIKNGELIQRIEADDDLDHSRGNGLAAPFPVDLDGDFVTDYAYAGDLYGNVWRFDLTSDNASDWRATRLFTATDAGGKAQPITTQPQVRFHPYGRNYGVMVYFGTGKYIENNDATLNKKLRNSFYGVWDRDVFTFNEANEGEPLYPPMRAAGLTRSNLQQQKVIKKTDRNGNTYRILSNNPVAYRASAAADPGDLGWYIDLPANTGEIIDTSPQLQGDTVVFSTTIPNLLACVAGGSGYLMVADAATGGRTQFSIFDTNGDAKIDADDRAPSENNNTAYVLSGILITQGAPGKARIANDPDTGDKRASVPTSNGQVIDLQGKFDDFTDGRISWREIRR